MNARKIVVPESVKTELIRVQADLEGRPNMAMVHQNIEVSFKDWLQQSLDEYPPLGKGRAAQRQGDKIAKVIEGADGEILFEEVDFAVAKKATDPGIQWNAGAHRKFGAFYDAMENAQTVEVGENKE